MQDQNNQPNATIPQNRDIFTSQPGQVQSPSPSQPVPPTPSMDKKQIISQTGSKPSSSRVVLILLGIVILVLVLGVLFRAISSRTTQNKETKIVWWSLREDEEAVKPLIEEYKQKNPTVSVDFVSQSSQDYRERLMNAMTRGVGPDIFEFHDSWVPMLINNLSLSKTDYSSDLYPVAVNSLKTKEGFVGVPLEYDGIALFINQDIMRAYGKNAPKTWDDLKKTALDLTIREQTGGIRQSGVALGVTSNVDYWEDILALLILQNGASLEQPSSLTGQSALTFYTNFSKVDAVWDTSLPDSSTLFEQGKLAMYFGKYEDAFEFSKNPNLHFQVVTLPQLPNTASTNSISYASYWVNGVWKKSVNSTIAWDFLNFMMTKENLKKLYENEKKLRGYGNLYPRPDMQNDLLSDSIAGSFIYQANFARSWYLNGKTFDGASGINSQVAKPFADAIGVINTNSTADRVTNDLQFQLTSVLASYGLVAKPLPTQQ